MPHLPPPCRPRCLVVGQDSLIGRGLLARLRNQGYDAWGSTRRPEPKRPNTLLLDLAQSTPEIPRHPEFEVAYLCAGITRLADCERDPQGSRTVNVDGLLKLASTLLEAGCKVVYLSSDAVFDGEHLRPEPDTPTSPRSPYGQQKLETESRLLELDRGQGRVAILRLTKVLCPDTPFIQTLFEGLFLGREIKAFDDLSLCPLSLDHVTAALAGFVQNFTPGLHHLSGADTCTYLELGQALCRRLGQDPGRIQAGSAPSHLHRPRHPGLGMVKTASVLGLQPQPFAEVLEHLVPSRKGDRETLSLRGFHEALVRRREENIRGAQAQLLAAQVLAPDQVDLLLELGDLFFRLNRSEEGLGCWHRAADQAGLPPEDFRDEALRLTHLDHLAATTRVPRTRIELQAQFAELLLGAQRWEEAFAVWLDLFAQAPAWTEPHRRMTAAFLFCGEISLAERVFQTRVDWWNREAQRLGYDRLGVRFLREHSTNIGHIGFLDAYVKAGLMGLRGPVRPVLVFGRKPVANRCYMDYWRTYLPDMVSDPTAYGPLEPLVDYLEDHVIGYLDAQGRQPMSYRWGTCDDILRAWEQGGGKPLLTLAETHAEQGRAILRTLGVPEGAWFVSLHVREDRWDQVRNVRIDSFLPAIQAITRRGGWVVRMGDPGMTPLPSLPQVVDYAHSPLRSEEMDVFLWAACRFFIGTLSGPYQVPPTFGVPCILTNIAPLVGTGTYGQDLRLYKRYRTRSDGRVLGYQELLDTGIGLVSSAGHLARLGVEPLENSPEEVEEVVEEMLDRLEGRPWPVDQVAQAAVRTLFSGLGALNCQVGSGFLRRHRDLFGPV